MGRAHLAKMHHQSFTPLLILGCAFASASDVPVPQETTNVSLGLNLSANATSESPAQASVKLESVANTTNDSVKFRSVANTANDSVEFETVANTTNVLPKPLLLVHGSYYQRQQRLRGTNDYGSTGGNTGTYDHDSAADRRRQGTEQGTDTYNTDVTVEGTLTVQEQTAEAEEEESSMSWVGGLLALVCLMCCMYGAYKFCCSEK